MRIFIYEYLSAGGLGPNAPECLRSEGWAMLKALAEDFTRIPGIHVTTLVDDHCPEPPGLACRRVNAEQELDAFCDRAATADATLVIAPEFFDLLLDRCGWVLASGGHLLGSLPSAIQLAGDKAALAQHWQSRGVRTPATMLAGPSPPAIVGPPWVCKPRHGAGSQATRLVPDRANWQTCFARACDDWPDGNLLAQTYVPGLAASVAILIGPGQCVPLPPASQHFSDDVHFQYRGGHVPLPMPMRDRAVRLALSALGGIEGLQGYVGVDLVLGAAEDGRDDHAIEINPRPTTSYIGLRQLCRENLARAWLDVHQGTTVKLTWRDGIVTFGVDGSVA